MNLVDAAAQHKSYYVVVTSIADWLCVGMSKTHTHCCDVYDAISHWLLLDVSVVVLIHWGLGDKVDCRIADGFIRVLSRIL